ncbi:TPA: hypothetical protein ACJYTU_001147, partial [Streptococcus pneumoniae]
KRKDEICPFSSLAFLQPTTVDKEPDFSIDFVIGRLPSYSKYRFEAADKTDEITLILNENQKAN